MTKTARRRVKPTFDDFEGRSRDPNVPQNPRQDGSRSLAPFCGEQIRFITLFKTFLPFGNPCMASESGCLQKTGKAIDEIPRCGIVSPGIRGKLPDGGWGDPSVLSSARIGDSENDLELPKTVHARH